MSSEELNKNRSGLIFKWRIKDFHVCPLRKKECLASPKFTSELIGNTEWSLAVYPSVEGLILIYLRSKEKSFPTLVQVELFIEQNDGSIVKQTYSDVKNIAQLKTGLAVKRAFIFELAHLFFPDDSLTVGCCIKKVSDTSFNAERFFANTEMSAEKFSLTFPLTFQSSKNPMQQLLTLPLISVNKKYPDFNISLKSPGYQHDVGSLIAQIKMARSSFRVFAVCKLSLQDADGKVEYLADGECWFEAEKDDETWQLKNSIPKQEELFRSEHSIFTLRCKLSVTDGTHSTKIENVFCSSEDETALQSLPDCPKKNLFKEKLRCLYADRRLCDFTIQVDGKEFPVHKTVLGTVSPVFCAMFEQEMKEKQSSLLTIEDIDADTMKRLIDFAYNGSVDGLQWDSAVKLFSAADKYEILDLKLNCAEFMNFKLSVENVTDVLTLADLHQDSYLKKAAEDFVHFNFKQVFESEKWNVFAENYMKLANNVMRGTLIKLSKNHLQWPC